MTKRFLVQFLRTRWGVPEPIRSVSLSADSIDQVQATIRGAGVLIWPSRAERVRVIDYDAGRTVAEWARPAT